MPSPWSIRNDTTYLNHGSFGPSPLCVQQARHDFSTQLENQPMDFFLRHMEQLLDDVAEQLGTFIGSKPENLIFTDNATFGMNIVAASVNLQPDDEVLLTDHEYGAVIRIWQHTCKPAGAKVVTQALPFPFTSEDDIVSSFMEGVTDKTKLIVISHVTSPTAAILPVKKICHAARQRKIPVCIDGPHAVAMLPLNLDKLDCDYYAASCHKWLSAPIGSGFLYVAPRRQQHIKPAVTSWGGSISGRPKHWKDEFHWSGTRNPAPCLAIPAAIEFLKDYGLEKFQSETHALAQYARLQITSLTGLETFIPDTSDWYGSMIALPLPPSDRQPLRPNESDPLQTLLWERYGIEIPITHWKGRRFLRVSCHLYNTQEDIDKLTEALKEQL